MDTNPYAPPTATVDYRPPGDPSSEPIEWTPSGLLSRGYERFKEEPAVLIGVLLVGYIINLGLSNAASFALVGRSTFGLLPAQVGWGSYFLVLAIGNALGMLVLSGTLVVYIACARGEPPTFARFFNGMGRFVTVFLSFLVFYAAMVVGFVLLIVPGFIVIAGLSQMLYLAADRGLNPLESARLSWELTRGRKGDILVFFLLAGLVVMGGALACGVGVLIAVPVVYLASAYLYLRLTAARQARDAEPLPAYPYAAR